MAKIQAVLFDFDGTLADTLPLCIHAFQLTCEHFTGKMPTVAEIYAQFGPSEEGVLENLIPGRLEETLPFYLGLYERLHSVDNLLFPGVDTALDRLKKRGKKLAIVTSKGMQSAAISMRILGLNRWIEAIEAGTPEKADKPRSMRLILERWQMTPAQAAYVGDAPYDMASAKEVGMLALGAAWAMTSSLRGGTDGKADAIFETIEAFLGWIEVC